MFVREAESKFPKGCLKIALKSPHSAPVEFNTVSVTWNSPKEVFVNLSAEGGVAVERQYTSLVVSSCMKIRHTKITWFNYGKIDYK
jgi:hypothetical protein